MVYTRNQPIASDDLSVSQPFLAANTNQADDSFGIDHYQFSNLTVNNGFHKQVTLPGNVSAPTPVGGYGDIYAVTTSAITQPYWVRDAQANIYNMLPIKAFGAFNGTSFATLSGLNLTCTGWAVGTGYVMTIPANVVNGLTYGVITSAANTGLNPGYAVVYTTITSATTFNVGFRNLATGLIVQVEQFSVIVIQG